MFSLRKTKLENTPACTVCYDVNIFRLFRILPCGHKFHRKCINPWAEDCNSCPLCRKAIDNTKPITKCKVDTEDDDRELALQLQHEIDIFNVLVNDDIVFWTCSDCGNNPCICERDLE